MGVDEETQRYTPTNTERGIQYYKQNSVVRSIVRYVIRDTSVLYSTSTETSDDTCWMRPLDSVPYPPSILSTCPLHTNSGCGKREALIN